MNIIVIGAGIAGSCAARLLRERGHHVTIVARPAPPHSEAATAVLRAAYQATPTEQEFFTASLELYRRWGIPLRGGALVTNYRTPGRPPRADRDWMLIDPAAPLLAPDVYGVVTGVDADPATVRLADGSTLHGDHVVIAAGAASALSAGGTETWGVTWVHPDPAVLTSADLRIHHLAPYKTVMVGHIGGKARLGSSSARTVEVAVTQGEAMLAACADLGYITTTTGWEPLLGARLRTQPLLTSTTPTTHVLAGFHRTGYALAPAAALRLADRLGPAR